MLSFVFILLVYMYIDKKFTSKFINNECVIYINVSDIKVVYDLKYVIYREEQFMFARITIQ